MEVRTATIHGREIAYRSAGSGPVLLLVHGITSTSRTWVPVGERLAASAEVIAPDLPGHGASESPAGDHSVGAYACALRDLLFTLGRERVTVVGHSLGGGIALQFGYQFPELVERLVLVDSGGLGRDVSPLLRAAALPGAEVVLALLGTEGFRGTVEGASRLLARVGLRPGTDLREVWQGMSSLAQPGPRRAFLRTVRAAIGPGGQFVSATDRLYLAEHVPTLVLWGARDRIIPLTHGVRAHELIPGSRLRVIDDAGHFPHLDAPDAVADAITAFVATTEPADVPRERWGEIVRAGPRSA